MSCLFNSLSHFFQEDNNTIRQIICNYLEKNGKIIEEGNHKELIDKNGKYAELWNHQVGGFIE